MFLDDKAEAFGLHLQFSGDPHGLAEHLISICLVKTEVVFEVFMLLDNFSTLDVGCRFVKGCDVFQLVRTSRGLFLCGKLYEWLTQLWVPVKPAACAGDAFSLLMFKSAIESAKPENEKEKKRTMAVARSSGLDVSIETTNSLSKDTTMYRSNRNGMIDVRDFSKHPAANFIVADGQNVPEEYLSPRAAASLFNVAQKYSETYASDVKLVFTAGSASNGKPGICGPKPCHKSHQQGSCVDIRYMSGSGRDLTGLTAYKNADVGRTIWLIKAFGKDGFTKILTGDNSRFGLFDNSPSSMDGLEAIHQHHLHVGY